MIDMPPEVQCIAQTIQGEAGGESRRGQEAVAQVIINRMRSGRYPNSACAVVRQRGQFNGFYRGRRPTSVVVRIARDALNGLLNNPVGQRLYFNTRGPANSLRIGNHYFW